MGENPSSHSEDRAYEERLKEQKKLEAQKEQSRPQESDQDKQMKVVLSERLPVMREEFQKQVKDWQERVKALREKEYSFSNFVTPENYWGFSTLIRGDGNTNSGAKVDIVEAYSELMGMRNIALPRLEYALKEGKRWEDIQKDPLMKSFLDSPEGKLMTSQGSTNPDEAMADYYLNKARELRKRIPKGELLAQPLYEKLKGTKHEAVAKQEMMNIAEEVWKKYVSEIGNELLGTDSLLVMAASGPVGGMISKGVKSERMIQASVGTMEAVNTSRLAKVLVPGVKVVQTETSNGTLLKVGKWTLNIGADAAKIGVYHEAVRYLGGNDAAKIAGYILLFIPGAKAGFERDMKAKFGTIAPTSANISAWALEKYGEDNLKRMLGNQGEEIVKQMREVAATATKNATATEVGVQGVKAVSSKIQTNTQRSPENNPPPHSNNPESPQIREGRFDIDNNPVYQEFPFLKKYAEILGDLKPNDIISDLGTQALIVKPRNLNGFVAKIERPNAEDKVIKEFNLHNDAYDIWLKGWKDGSIPKNVYVPRVEMPKGVDEGIILIEQIQGQSLHTKALVENAYKIRKDAPPLTQEEKEFVSTLTDGDAKKFIIQKYNYTAAEAFRVIELYSADHLGPYLYDRMRPTFKTDLSKAMEYMSKQQPGISQGDQHPGNFMVTNDGKIYIIDWGRAKMTNVPNPSNP